MDLFQFSASWNLQEGMECCTLQDIWSHKTGIQINQNSHYLAQCATFQASLLANFIIYFNESLFNFNFGKLPFKILNNDFQFFLQQARYNLQLYTKHVQRQTFVILQYCFCMEFLLYLTQKSLFYTTITMIFSLKDTKILFDWDGWELFVELMKHNVTLMILLGTWDTLMWETLPKMLVYHTKHCVTK